MGGNVAKNKSPSTGAITKNAALIDRGTVSNANVINVPPSNAAVVQKSTDRIDLLGAAEKTKIATLPKEGVPSDMSGALPLKKDTTTAYKNINTNDAADVTVAGNVWNRIALASNGVNSAADKNNTENMFYNDSLLTYEDVVIVKDIPKTSRYWSSNISGPSNPPAASLASALGDRTVGESTAVSPCVPTAPVESAVDDNDCNASPTGRQVERSSRFTVPLVAKIRTIEKERTSIAIQNWIRNVDISAVQRQIQKK